MIKIREATAKLLKEEFQIEPEVTEILFARGILSEYNCRNVLIKKEYKDKAQPKERQRIKGRLAEKYFVSVELIRKIVE